MTSTAPPNAPGSRRAIPDHATARHAQLFRALLQQDKRWVLRPDWQKFLAGEVDLDEACAIDRLSRDHRIGACSWLRQQQHHLYRVIEDGTVAPDGWIESQPLYEALER